MIFLDEPNRLSENAKAVEEEFRQSCRNRQEKGEQNLSEAGCVPGKRSAIS